MQSSGHWREGNRWHGINPVPRKPSPPQFLLLGFSQGPELGMGLRWLGSQPVLFGPLPRSGCQLVGRSAGERLNEPCHPSSPALFFHRSSLTRTSWRVRRSWSLKPHRLAPSPWSDPLSVPLTPIPNLKPSMLVVFVSPVLPSSST